MDSVKKYYEMVEDGRIVESSNQNKYLFSYQELKNVIDLAKLNPNKSTQTLVDTALKAKQ